MKIMATSCPSDEHLFPMLPTLWALHNAGHDVLLALPAASVPVIAATGLPTISISEEVSVSVHKPPKSEAMVTDLADHIIEQYLPITTLTVNRAVALAEAWRPDLVLCSDWEYAGPIAAARIGAPTVMHNRGMLPHPAINAQVAEALRPIHRQWGLNNGAPEHWKIIDNCPQSLQWTTPPANAIPARYVGFHRPGPLPQWVFERPEVPRVLVAMSNDPLLRHRTDMLTQVTQALLPLDVEVILATTEHIGNDRLVEVPRRTRLTHGMPLSHLVPTCTAVINDGSASAVMAAAIAGVPQLALPQVSGQFQHADRIAEVGAGLFLQPEQASVEAVAAAVRTLLSELGQRAIARRLQAENAARPRLDDVVRTLERELTGQACPSLPERALPTPSGGQRWKPSHEAPTTPVAGGIEPQFPPVPIPVPSAEPQPQFQPMDPRFPVATGNQYPATMVPQYPPVQEAQFQPMPNNQFPPLPGNPFPPVSGNRFPPVPDQGGYAVGTPSANRLPSDPALAYGDAEFPPRNGTVG